MATHREIKNMAEMCLKHAAYPKVFPTDLRPLIENCGLIINQKLSAVHNDKIVSTLRYIKSDNSRQSDGKSPELTITANLSGAWHRAMIAHALGHIYLHPKTAFENTWLSYSGRSAAYQEREAVSFMFLLMLPDDKIKSWVYNSRYTINEMAEMANLPTEVINEKIKLIID